MTNNSKLIPTFWRHTEWDAKIDDLYMRKKGNAMAFSYRRKDIIEKTFLPFGKNNANTAVEQYELPLNVARNSFEANMQAKTYRSLTDLLTSRNIALGDKYDDFLASLDPSTSSFYGLIDFIDPYGGDISRARGDLDEQIVGLRSILANNPLNQVFGMRFPIEDYDPTDLSHDSVKEQLTYKGYLFAKARDLMRELNTDLLRLVDENEEKRHQLNDENEKNAFSQLSLAQYELATQLRTYANWCNNFSNKYFELEKMV